MQCRAVCARAGQAWAGGVRALSLRNIVRTRAGQAEAGALGTLFPWSFLCARAGDAHAGALSKPLPRNIARWRWTGLRKCFEGAVALKYCMHPLWAGASGVLSP